MSAPFLASLSQESDPGLAISYSHGDTLDMTKGNQARPLAGPDPWLFPAVVNTALARHPVLQVGPQISKGGLEVGVG